MGALKCPKDTAGLIKNWEQFEFVCASRRNSKSPRLTLIPGETSEFKMHLRKILFDINKWCIASLPSWKTRYVGKSSMQRLTEWHRYANGPLQIVLVRGGCKGGEGNGVRSKPRVMVWPTIGRNGSSVWASEGPVVLRCCVSLGDHKKRGWEKYSVSFSLVFFLHKSPAEKP